MNMKQVNAKRKVNFLLPYLCHNMRLLDFGCGDMTFAKELKKTLPALKITGVDVLDFGKRYKDILYKRYDGHVLPFGNGAFDAVVSWHVFHHTTEPFALMRECMRVAKNSIYIVEPTFRGWWDIPGMCFMDWLFNVWKDRSISMSYRFASKDDWKREIARLGWTSEQTIDVELLPKWLPTGRSILFVCRKKKSFSGHKVHAS